MPIMFIGRFFLKHAATLPNFSVLLAIHPHTPMASKYELKTSKNGQFVFNLKAANGQVILTSESYTTKDAALNGIESVRKNSQVDTNFERKTATNNQPYFTLKAANGQTIGKSELYSGTAAMENGIASVKTNASGASVEEVT